MYGGIRIGVALLFVAAMTGAAHAKDLCLGVSADAMFVGRDFKVPGRGKCKPWNGFVVTSFANVALSTGTGCTSSDGVTFRLHLSSARENLAFEDYMQIPLPSLSGGVYDEFVTSPPVAAGQLHLTGIGQLDCGAKKVPVP